MKTVHGQPVYPLQMRQFLAAIAASVLATAAFGDSQNVVQKQDLEQIRIAVTRYVQKQIRIPENQRAVIQASKLDTRLHLKPCPATPVFYLSAKDLGKPRFSVKVSCPTQPGWSLYAPVSVRYYGPVVVASRHLSRNDHISPDDISVRDMEINRMNNSYFDKAEQVIGKIVKQPWRAGRSLHPRMLRAPHLVKRGESVTIIANNPRFSIRMKGKALMPGAKGERIRVKNTSSARTVEAVVISRGIVKVSL